MCHDEPCFFKITFKSVSKLDHIQDFMITDVLNDCDGCEDGYGQEPGYSTSTRLILVLGNIICFLRFCSNLGGHIRL